MKENQKKQMVKEMVKVGLEKKESPIVARMRRKLWNETKLTASQRKKQRQTREEDLTQSEQVHDIFAPLAKSEYQIDQHSNGDVKFSFGPEVPEHVKKRAAEWAKKRGLRPKMSSLGKSNGSVEWILFGK